MIGKTAENFILKDQFGNDFELYKNLDTKLLLVFYPKDNTPVCSAQLTDYEVNYDEFLQNKIKVVGVNKDSSESHSAFCENKKINFPLLSDTEKKVSKFYKAINLLGGNKRKLVLIDTNKKIIYEETVLPVSYINAPKLMNNLRDLKLIEWA